MDLYEALPGSVGKIYWYASIERKLADAEIEVIRQKAVSETLKATLTNLMYEPGKAINSLDGVIQRGWNDAKQQIELLENGTTIKSQYIMIDNTSIDTIKEIESESNFLNWTNPILIDEIKSIQYA
jgi:hypothetical protein